MPSHDDRWLDSLVAHNRAFRERIDADRLPVDRTPGRFLVVTCMDPRVNLEAFGIAPFSPDGAGASDVRVVRTVGAMSEERSLVVAIHLAGVREIAMVMHSDCGCCLALAKIDAIVDSLRRNLNAEAFDAYAKRIGEPLRDKLTARLKAFADPREAVRREIDAVRQQPFVPDDVVLHGLVYELATGAVDVVVSGYGD